MTDAAPTPPPSELPVVGEELRLDLVEALQLLGEAWHNIDWNPETNGWVVDWNEKVAAILDRDADRPIPSPAATDEDLVARLREAWLPFRSDDGHSVEISALLNEAANLIESGGGPSEERLREGVERLTNAIINHRAYIYNARDRWPGSGSEGHVQVTSGDKELWQEVGLEG